MYADDLVRWLLKILDNSRKDCPIYNVGSDESVSIKQLAEKISSISNAKVAVKILGSTVQKEHIDIYCPSITKAHKLNAQIKIQLSESIDKTIKFYESQ
jgi:nucleoside-diphosphate-sugar epimerase